MKLKSLSIVEMEQRISELERAQRRIFWYLVALAAWCLILELVVTA